MAAILCGLVPEAELIVIFPITEPFPSTFPHAFFFRDPAKKNGRSVKKPTPPRQLRHDALLRISFPAVRAMLSPQHDHREPPIRQPRQLPGH